MGDPYYSNAVMPGRVEIKTSPHLTVIVEDWSEVRSHSRARRRMKRGHRQRIIHRVEPDPKIYTLPDGSMVGHPVTMDHAVKAIGKRIQEKHDAMFMAALTGKALA